jgi:hypothetical protein
MADKKKKLYNRKKADKWIMENIVYPVADKGYPETAAILGTAASTAGEVIFPEDASDLAMSAIPGAKLVKLAKKASKVGKLRKPAIGPKADRALSDSKVSKSPNDPNELLGNKSQKAKDVQGLFDRAKEARIQKETKALFSEVPLETQKKRVDKYLKDNPYVKERLAEKIGEEYSPDMYLKLYEKLKGKL